MESKQPYQQPTLDENAQLKSVTEGALPISGIGPA